MDPTAPEVPGAARPADPATERLLTRFVDGLPDLVPLVAVWVHGSIAEGTDYRPGRSDLDLIAVVERPCTQQEEQRLTGLHRRLERDEPLAGKLHCSYLPTAELADPGREHPTWAHRELYRRTVSPVTRAELHRFGQVRYGRPVGGLLPEVTDRQLREYVAGDIRDNLLRLCDDERLFRGDGWVDFGMLALPRAAVTLRDGRLITKAEAFGVLAELEAPAEVVADVRRRRYGTGNDAGATAVSGGWRARRARLTVEFLRSRGRELVAAYDGG
ncbi:nucleotidyltransferase [Streptomyces sp. NPDC058953]|uniref:nucleotidyltransferase domain-containing protein n=1 Tax=unclassified Streptomyces TaxID=2593676 RepID=UPI003679B693